MGASPHSSWGLGTRAAHLKHGHDGALRVAWGERFVLTFPAALSEQLVRPAPGDNPYAGVPLELQFELVVPAASSGLGAVVARGALPISFQWMADQVTCARCPGLLSALHTAVWHGLSTGLALP